MLQAVPVVWRGAVASSGDSCGLVPGCARLPLWLVVQLSLAEGWVLFRAAPGRGCSVCRLPWLCVVWEAQQRGCAPLWFGVCGAGAAWAPSCHAIKLRCAARAGHAKRSFLLSAPAEGGQ